MRVVVDTSAVISMLMPDEDSGFFAEQMAKSNEILIGAPTGVECTMVLERVFPGMGRAHFDEWLSRTGAQVVPFSETHFRIAHDAYLLFGKGRHPAALNYGDCMSYAVALHENLPLMQKGEDFKRATGISLINPRLRS